MIATYSTYMTLAAFGMMIYLTDAHQLVLIPAPTFTVTDKSTKMNPIAFLENQGVKVEVDPLPFLKSKGKTLREYMDNPANFKVTEPGATFECGLTDPHGKRQPIPADGKMRSTGYTHEGPCEIWIDDTMVKRGDNCHYDIGDKPVSYPIDFSVCKGECMIRWYWFGNRLISKTHRSWQIYKECIPIQANAKSEARESSNATTPAPAPPKDTKCNIRV